MRPARLSHQSPHPSRRRGVAVAFITAAFLATSFSGTSAAAARPAADPAVITDWNAVAVATIVTDAGKANAEAFMWYAFEQAAVYNAVVGITGRYELYNWHVDAPHGASPEAAAAAAAHRVLLTYFAASHVRLDTAYAASLAKIPDGLAKTRGIRFGERAAARIIKLRIGDGRFAPIMYTVPPGPGVWQSTPPANAPFFDPWLSQLRPLLLKSPSQFRPGPPPALTSRTYTREFNEVKRMGSATSTARSKAQSETALFISGIPVGPLQGALRDLVTRHHMDISDSARLFAAVDLSLADAIGAAWDAKFHYHWWRPITAIQRANTDGNPDTLADAGWQPMIVTPPYPDYTSGLTAVIGAATRALTRLLGTSHIDLNISSPVTGTVRHYELASQLNREAVNARVWSGLHFRTADVVSNRMGKKVGDWAMDHYFKPAHEQDGD